MSLSLLLTDSTAGLGETTLSRESGCKGSGSEAGEDGDNDYISDDVHGYGDHDVSANVLANLDATGVTGSGNLKC